QRGAEVLSTGCSVLRRQRGFLHENPLMTQSPGAIRAIAWRELFPWLILFRTFRIAISPSMLALATAAMLVAPLGWWIAERMFLTVEQRQVMRLANFAAARGDSSQLADSIPLAARSYLPAYPTPVLEAYFSLSEPLRRFFRLDISLGQAAYY